ncbi:major facilitator superfamily domain-containing protein [Aspergillus heterothallicus]
MEKERDVENIEKVEHARPATTTERRPGYAAPTEEEARLDKRINLKMDLIIVPLLAAGFLLQGIDKSNIGNAATTDTFVSDTNIRETDVSNSVSLFAATYVPFMPISVAIGRLIGPSRWIPILLLTWGAVTTAQCAMNSRADLYGLRLLLGICEAGFLPSTYYYIGTLYPAYMAGLRMGIVSTSFTFSGAFSALIAYGILQVHSSPTWKNWQLLFIIEGAATMLIGAVTLFALPHKLSTAWFLTDPERAHAIHRMHLDTAAVDGATGANTEEMDHTVRWSDLRTALTDWRKMLIIVFTGCAAVPAYGFAIFLPLIVRGMGYDGVRANLMCVPPFLGGAAALVAFVFVSDRVRERSLTAAAAMLFSVVGYIALIACGTGRDNVRYGFLFVIMVGAGSVNPLTAAWLNDNTPDKATRSIVMGLYGWNNVSGVIAGQIYSAKYGPSYYTSVCVTLGIVVFGMLGIVGTRVSYMLENRRRRELIAGWTEEEFERERADMNRRGHEKRFFMFGY